MTTVSITASDGSGTFSGYLALPTNTATATGAGILVIQEIFGVNQVMRDLCDGFADQGYVALCPDLFWRQEPGVDITDKSDEEWQKAFSLYQGFDEAKGVDDLKAALTVLRGHAACNGKVGSVGYCLGGKLAYLMATRSDADCNVGYYGVGIQDALAERSSITNPLMLHMAGLDQFVPAEAQESIAEAVAANDMVTLFRYPDQDHAFARIGGAHYDQAAAHLADGRTAEFFASQLG